MYRIFFIKFQMLFGFDLSSGRFKSIHGVLVVMLLVVVKLLVLIHHYYFLKNTILSGPRC